MTPELDSAAKRWHTTNAAAPQPLCRCPSTYSSPFAQQNDTLRLPEDLNNPDRSAVQVSMSISSGNETMVVLFSRQGGAWIATDTYCGSDRMNLLTAGTPKVC
jgi:hypothetical protein